MYEETTKRLCQDVVFDFISTHRTNRTAPTSRTNDASLPRSRTAVSGRLHAGGSLLYPYPRILPQILFNILPLRETSAEAKKFILKLGNPPIQSAALQPAASLPANWIHHICVLFARDRLSFLLYIVSCTPFACWGRRRNYFEQA